VDNGSLIAMEMEDGGAWPRKDRLLAESDALAKAWGSLQDF